MTKAVAVGFRVHVRPDESDTDKAIKKAGLYVPEHQDTRQARVAVDSGIVLDIGPTAFVEYGGEPWCKVGDHIVYARHAGYRVGDDVLVINDSDVVAKLEEDNV